MRAIAVSGTATLAVPLDAAILPIGIVLLMPGLM
jgi:hypothetical protein